jgi:hypothetical protein
VFSASIPCRFVLVQVSGMVQITLLEKVKGLSFFSEVCRSRKVARARRMLTRTQRPVQKWPIHDDNVLELQQSLVQLLKLQAWPPCYRLEHFLASPNLGLGTIACISEHLRTSSCFFKPYSDSMTNAYRPLSFCRLGSFFKQLHHYDVVHVQCLSLHNARATFSIVRIVIVTLGLCLTKQAWWCFSAPYSPT